jgi:hypothetical protein
VIVEDEVNVERHLEQTLEKNLISARTHRPELFELLMNAPLTGRYQTVTNGAGQLTVAAVEEGETLLPVVPGADPIAHTRATLQNVPNPMAPVILAGTGDATLLAAIASRRLNPNPLGVEQPVVVVEPEPELLLRGMQIHDLSGERGPFQDPRFFWCVGPNWAQRFRELLMVDLTVGAPRHAVRGGVPRGDIEATLRRAAADLGKRFEETRTQVHARYAQLPLEELCARLGGEGDRQPVVLLVTSLFTTVLRYTTHDLARAFQAIGFRPLIVVEGAPHQRYSPLRIVHELLQHEPDLMVVIDQLRTEYSGALPPELPFVSWVQDELPNIANRETAKTLVPRDFLWLRPTDYYEKQWGYPARQLIRSRCLTTPRPLPDPWPQPSQDLVYLSHASKSREQILEDPLEWVEPHGLDRALVERLIRRAAERYGAGEAVFDVRAFVAAEEPALGTWTPRRVTWHDGVPRQELEESELDRYAQPLYRAISWLHRQQGLRWAMEIAGARGLKLALFGNGWDEVPEFKDVWRGSVDYQRDLTAVLQASRAVLHLEPWSVVAHWRGLDALASGAVVLARRTPQDGVLARLAQLVDAAPEPCASLPELVRCLGQSHTDALRDLAVDLSWLPFPPVDPVAHVLGLRQSGLQGEELSMPRRFLSRLSFSSKLELEGRIERLLAEPADHRALARSVRDEVLEFYSYERGARELVAAVRERLLDRR